MDEDATAAEGFSPVWHLPEGTNSHWRVEIEGLCYECIEFGHAAWRADEWVAQRVPKFPTRENR
jgi:hypothetical protein